MTQTNDFEQERALEKMLELSRRLGECADLDGVLQTVIDALRDLLHAERATVFVFEPATQTLCTRVAHGLGEKSTIRIPVTQGIAGACALDRSIINIPDAYADERFDRNVDARTGYRTRSILAVPLLDDESGLVGVAQVLNKVTGTFDIRDERLAQGMAAHAAIAVRRATLIEDRIARVRLQEEMDVASSIQRRAFPTEIPQLPRYSIGAGSIPAVECGGDVFDFVSLSGSGLTPRGEDPEKVLLLIGDATGHGVGPALSVMQVRSMLRMALRFGLALSEVVRELNAQLKEDLPMGRFVTSWLGVLDPADNTVEYVSAGQAPIFIYRQAEDRFETLEGNAPPLGILLFPPPMCATQRCRLEPGDMLLLLTDGYYEGPGAQDSSELFGDERVQKIVRNLKSASPDRIIAALDEAVLAYGQSTTTPDDRTAVIVHRLE